MATKEVKDKKATKQAAKPATKLVAKKVAQTKKTETVASTIKAEDKKVEKKRQTGLTVDMLSPTGDKKGTITLPEAIFNAKVNKPLMAQAVRVYLANQRSGSAHTKTRGEVDGSSKKIYKQKGTGNARHGSIRAPIFVGGGNVFGPRVRDYSLDLSKPMKKKSLASALTTKLQDGAVIVVADVSSLPLKTKEFAGMFKSLDCDRSTLMLYGKEEATVGRAVRNLENVSYMPISQAHTYAVIHSKHIILTEQAVKELSNLVSS